LGTKIQQQQLHCRGAKAQRKRNAGLFLAAVFCNFVLLRFAFFALTSITATAAEYPNRPLRIIVPFTAGGSTDVLARMIGKNLTDAWGQQVVVDNRAGANGVIAAELIAKSNADGHSLLMVAIGHAINPSLQKKLPYDTARDFQPISLTAILPLLLAVHPSVKASNVQELIALAKSSPKPLTYASGGIGSSQHLAGELINTMAQIRMTHVPYKGGGPGLVDLLAGQVNVMASTILSVAPHGRTGKLRVLGITTARRSAAWPDVPTVAEAGIKGYESIAWYGLVAPAGLPRPVLDKLSAEVIKGTRSKEMQDALIKQGAEPVGSNPREFTAFITSETAKYAKVIRDAGIKAE
jgi:tripartite-type tricarboxylate transporter receptor subunit TctC